MKALRNISISILFLLSATLSFGQLSRANIYYISQELIIKQKYSSAIDVLNVLLSQDNMSDDGYFLRGVAKYNLGDIVGAERDFSLAISVNSVYTMAYQYRAIARSMLGNYNDALHDFSTAIDIRPDQEGIYYSRGVTYFQTQQFSEAIADFNHFLRRKPRSVDGYVNRGTCFLMSGDTLKAMEDYNKAINTNIYDGSGYFRRGILNLQLDSLEVAFQDLSTAIKLDTTSIASYFYRALTHNRLNRPMDAIADFNFVISKDSTNSLTYFNRAILLSQIGDYNNAMKDYDKVAQFSPKNVLVYFNRAILNSRLGELERAEKDFTKAISLYPDFANAYLLRSDVRLRLMDKKGAEADYKIGQNKIEEYRISMNEHSFAQYADTSKLFSSLLSFDVDFGNKDFDNVSTQTLGFELLPMHRFVAAKATDIFEKKFPYHNNSISSQEKALEKEKLVLACEEEQFDKEEIEKMKEKLEREIDKGKATSQSYFALASLQHSLRQYTTAIANYSKAIALEPNNGFYFMNRATASAQMTLFISQLSTTTQRLIIDGDPVNQLQTNKMTYSYGDAIADINRAIALDDSVAQFYYNKAEILYLSDDLVGAIECYTKALDLYPYFGEAYYNRAMLQLRLKEYKKGLLDLSAAGEMGIKKAYEQLKDASLKAKYH